MRRGDTLTYTHTHICIYFGIIHSQIREEAQLLGEHGQLGVVEAAHGASNGHPHVWPGQLSKVQRAAVDKLLKADVWRMGGVHTRANAGRAHSRGDGQANLGVAADGSSIPLAVVRERWSDMVVNSMSNGIKMNEYVRVRAR